MKIDDANKDVNIKVFVSKTFSNMQILSDVTSGVEEESIPFDIQVKETDDGVLLAYEGATESSLQVGIGIDSKGIIAVHYTTLDKNTPLFKIDYNFERDKIRKIGSNSARLVKGVPFIL